MNRLAIVILTVLIAAYPSCSRAQEPAEVSAEVFTDESGKTFMRVTLNESVPAALLYREDLPYVLLTRRVFDQLKISLKGKPYQIIRVGDARLKVKMFLIKKICVGNSISEGVEGAVILAGAVPPEMADGAIGKKLFDELRSAVGLKP